MEFVLAENDLYHFIRQFIKVQHLDFQGEVVLETTFFYDSDVLLTPEEIFEKCNSDFWTDHYLVSKPDELKCTFLWSEKYPQSHQGNPELELMEV
jgi:hypothetical protein